MRDAAITEVLAGFYGHGHRQPESVYGSMKIRAHLQRQGFPVAKSTVERLCAATAGKVCVG